MPTKDTRKPVAASKSTPPGVGMGEGLLSLLKGVVPVTKAALTAISLKGTDAWEEHAYTDQVETKPHMMSWAGGYNRKSRNAASFYGGYDAAVRWPDKTEELKTLAKGYQMTDALKSMFKKNSSFKDEMEDALANISGIESAERDRKSGIRINLGVGLEELILDKAKNYSSTYTETIKE